MEPIRMFEPILGADVPYRTMLYHDVPIEFRLDSLSIPENYHYTLAIKDNLVRVANNYYRNYEINGNTLYDFFMNLQVDYDINGAKFETMLSKLEHIDIAIGATEIYTEQANDKNTTDTNSSYSDTLKGTDDNSIKKNTEYKETVADTDVSKSTENKNTTSDRTYVGNEQNNTKGTENITANKDANVISTESDKSTTNRTNRNSIEKENSTYVSENDKFVSNETGNNTVTDDKIKQSVNNGQNKNVRNETTDTTVDNDNVQSGTDTNIPLTVDTYNAIPISKIDKSMANMAHGNTHVVGTGTITDENKSTVSENESNRNVSNGTKNLTNTDVKNRSDIGQSQESVNGSESGTDTSNRNKSDIEQIKENTISSKNDNTNISKSDIETNKGNDNTTIKSDSSGSSITDRLSIESNTGQTVRNETKNGLSDTSVKGQSDRIRQYTKHIDRVGAEQPIDILDDYLAKYPEIYKMFISFFKHSFIMYETLTY